jgi:hypothetical protein
MTLEQLLTNETLLNLVLVIVTMVIVPLVRQWLIAKVGGEKYEQLAQFILKLVESAQQQWSSSDTEANREKKLFVLSQAAAFAQTIGLKVDEKTLNALIEAAVWNLKAWQPVVVGREETTD